MFVLREKGTLNIICIDKTLDKLTEKIRKAYWSTRALKPKADKFELSDYMLGKIISELRIRDIKEKL